MKNLLLTAAMFITFAVNAQKSLLEGVWKNTDNATTYLTVITVDDSEKVTNIYSFSFSTNKEILEEIMESVHTCCAITMEPDEVLGLCDKLKEYLEND